VSAQAAPVPVDWEAVEAWLGLRLPSDYKEIATRHGPLEIGEFVCMHVPCVQDERFDYSSWLKETHRHCRIVSRHAPPYEPPLFHPMPGGLLAWGTTRSSNELFWDTSASGDPDQWPVVMFDLHAAHQKITPIRHLGTPLSETLAALVRTGLEQPQGDRLGPLPPTARRIAFLPDPRPWTPPVVKQHAVPEPIRREALTQGSGMETLTLLVAPPERPYLGEGTWQRLFDELGTRLPAEYIAVMECYGAGIWSDWLCFFTALRFADRRGLAFHAKRSMENYRMLRADYPEFHPLAIWPEPGGFLPFASTTYGDEIGWLTIGEPEGWPLLVNPRQSDPGPPLEGSLVEILLSWVRGKPIPCFKNLDPLDDPLEFADFSPWDDDSYY